MWEIRTITQDDADEFRSRISRGFGRDPDTDEASAERFRAIFEYDRTLAVFEEAEIIGTGSAFSLEVTVPGGAAVPMAGTTVISVQPTHRRRGVLRALMERHLDQVAEKGEPLAGLWASETPIYRRFGYDPATFRMSSEIDARGLTMITAGDSPSRVRIVEPDEAESALPEIYERHRGDRAGMLSRSEAWWRHRLLADPPSWRGGKSEQRHVVVEGAGETLGYARYRQDAKWEDFVADGEIEVMEVIAADPGARGTLLSFLTNIDLFPRVRWWNMPVDDPFPHMVSDSRRVRRRLVDALWIRIMDVPSALSARRYEEDGEVTIAVTDEVRPATGGVFRLTSSSGSMTCERVDAEAVLACDIDVLGHLYLGGGDAIAMASAGRLHGDPAAVETLHRMFRTIRAPWCPEVF